MSCFNVSISKSFVSVGYICVGISISLMVVCKLDQCKLFFLPHILFYCFRFLLSIYMFYTRKLLCMILHYYCSSCFTMGLVTESTCSTCFTNYYCKIGFLYFFYLYCFEVTIIGGCRISLSVIA